MSQIISTIVYTLDELSGSARENARSWYREHALNDDWYQNVFDEFIGICNILGVDIKMHRVTEAIRELARWLYNWLETEYDWQTSPAIVDEDIIDGKYTFTETGQRFG